MCIFGTTELSGKFQISQRISVGNFSWLPCSLLSWLCGANIINPVVCRRSGSLLVLSCLGHMGRLQSVECSCRWYMTLPEHMHIRRQYEPLLFSKYALCTSSERHSSYFDVSLKWQYFAKLEDILVFVGNWVRVAEQKSLRWKSVQKKQKHVTQMISRTSVFLIKFSFPSSLLPLSHFC